LRQRSPNIAECPIGDFIEFIELAGLGQAEVRALTRADVDLDASRIVTYRHKTRQGFAIPIYPQLRLWLRSCAAARRTTSGCSSTMMRRRRSAMRASG
jgi:integrase